MRVRCVHTFGKKAGEALDLALPVRIGRAPDNDLRFDPNFDRDASGHHAEIRLEEGRLVLVDLGSRNGTFRAGSRIERHLLSPGDELTFGKAGPRVRFDFDPAAALAARKRPAPAGPRPPAALPAVPPAGELASPAFRAAGGFPQPAPPAGAQVGQKTIAIMISHALDAARRPGRTREIGVLVEAQVAKATEGQRRTTRVLGGLLAIALAALAGLIVWSRGRQDDIAELRAELTGLPPEDPRRREIEARLGRLHPPSASEGRSLYERSKRGVFMLATRGGQGFCTAFAVRPDVLATNAHCVAEAKRRGDRVVALENEGGGRVFFDVTGMRVHPQYRAGAGLTPDVAVATISGRSAAVLELATGAELAGLGPGDAVYLVGFPGRLTDERNPAATFLAGSIGRITNAAGRPADFGAAWLVQHDAPAGAGTSGSPVFGSGGKVIAVNAGGYLESEAPGGERSAALRESPYKFAIRIDKLDPLLR